MCKVQENCQIQNASMKAYFSHFHDFRPFHHLVEIEVLSDYVLN